MPEIFRLKGAAVTPAGDRIINLRVAVVDKDFVLDDLLGVGFTDKDGAFRLSFTREEFNQDFGESEDLPDIHLIFSRRFDDGQFRAVFEVDFADLSFEGHEEDLGDISISTWAGSGAPALSGVEPTPGWGKKVKRLSIDHDLVAHCLAEVTPLVESLTGWSGLLDDLKVEVTDNIAPFVTGQIFGLIGTDATSLEGRIANGVVDRLVQFLALYDPFTHTIVVHEDKAGRNNLDALKVVIGHELVHVGQFKNHPELLTEQRAHLEKLAEDIKANPDAQSFSVDAFKNSPLNKRMMELEGYAYYIQKDFLEKHYNMATFFNHRSVLEAFTQSVLHGALPDAGTMAEVKSDQYTDGIELFRKRGKRGEPVSFK